uniref:AAA+ ATPase domain-containing protein n=1 Tax=Chromera velia CCMP2878 TaxID=1169474 RepID=A0A0G4HFR0_9ALVE|eukprot:Cvel_27134.t1-p1 / transcript=Cvel_27134.t1 / gene=Cvel_27134 / organism=Chromera_velia_CCMP2878 / gene_product=Putative ribosome biogenesis ATPase nvl, putative / transcript_product=Putative ribosome biogenesis ATPase nvl, putative / location=Cvel_scaffold3336:969-3292(-) / protein_length=585 / sequence_SO=supercontig / SO=protein_coding / is_pseudo=false
MDASFSSHELLKSSAHWFSKLGHLFGGFAGLRANAVKALRNVSFVLHLLDRSFAEFTQTRAGGIIPVYTFEGVSGSGKSFLAKCLAKSSPQKRLRWPLNILSLDASALAAAAAASEGSSFTSTSLLGLLSLSLSTPHNDEDQERGDRKSSAEKCMEEARKAGGDGRFQEALSLLTVAARWLKGQRNRRRGSVGDALDDWIFLVVEQSEILCHGGPGKRKYFDGESQPLRGPAVCQIIETVRLFLDIWEKERLQIVLLLPISSEGVSFVDGPLIPSEWRDCVVERFDLNEYLPLSLTDRVDILRVQLGWHGDGEKEKVLKDVGQWSVSLSPADLSAVARCAVLRSLWKDENRVPKKTDGISEDVFLRALRAVQPSATKTLKAVIERPHTGGGTQSGSDCPALVRDAEGQWVEAAGFAAVGGEDELLAGLRREVVLPFRSLSEGKWGRSSFDEGCSGDVKSESGRMRGEEQQRPTSVILPSLPPVGILIEGETGTGKSLVSRALAVECGATLVSVSCTSLLSSLVGETERQVKDLFRRAKASAPAVLLLEDVHAIAPTVPSRKEGGGARDCSSVTQALLQSVDDLRQ